MISVCMPYYQRQDLLDITLKSYRKHYKELDYEVVICDDGSPWGVKAEDCKVVSLPKKNYALNPCVPINRAVEASSGDVLVLTGPEIEHKHSVLPEMLDRLKPNTFVVAACQDINTGVWLAKSGIKNGQLPIPKGSGFHFCAMLHRETWDLVGGFDEAYRYGQACDDTDFLWMLERAGVEFLLCDDLIVFHRRTQTRWPTGGLSLNHSIWRAKWGDYVSSA